MKEIKIIEIINTPSNLLIHLRAPEMYIATSEATSFCVFNTWTRLRELTITPYNLLYYFLKIQ